MKNATLVRTVKNNDGVFGHLVVDDLHLHTAEPEIPREGNKGCIPPGAYRVEWEPYGKFKGYAVKNVPGFENIEIHVGNTESDTAGCILLGNQRGRLGDKEAVLNSRLAVSKLNEHMEHGAFNLLIIERFGG